MIKALIAAAALALPGIASAAERTYSVTDFDRVRVDGNYRVMIETGRSPGARALGTTAALDRVAIRVEGRMLIVRRNLSAWGGDPKAIGAPVIIRVTTPMVRAATINGSGALTINKMRAQRVSLSVQGSGALSVGEVETDRLDAAITGAGTLNMGGRTAIAIISGRGSGNLEAGNLTVSDLQLVWESAGVADIAALKTAKVTTLGAGTVTVTGDAACVVQANGPGEVSCGTD